MTLGQSHGPFFACAQGTLHNPLLSRTCLYLNEAATILHITPGCCFGCLGVVYLSHKATNSPLRVRVSHRAYGLLRVRVCMCAPGIFCLFFLSCASSDKFLGTRFKKPCFLFPITTTAVRFFSTPCNFYTCGVYTRQRVSLVPLRGGERVRVCMCG